MKCKYKRWCDYYKKDSFTCNKVIFSWKRDYCGAYRGFELQRKENSLYNRFVSRLEEFSNQ